MSDSFIFPSGVVPGAMEMMSACFAASANIFGPPAPTAIGGRGPCRGRGLPDGLTAHQAVEDGQRLVEPADAGARRLELDAGLVELVLHPSRADAQLEPPLGQHVDGRGLFGQDRRVAEAVGEDRRAQADGAGGLRQGAERGERTDLVAQVVGDGKGVEAVLLSGLGELDELACAALFLVALTTGSEAELPGHPPLLAVSDQNSTDDTVRGAHRPGQMSDRSCSLH